MTAPARRAHPAGPLRSRLLVAAAVIAVLVAAWVVVARQAMLLVPDYRDDLEALVEARLGTSLSIGALRGHMDGTTPVFVLEDVQLGGGDQAAPLSIRDVELSVDVFGSLLARTLRPSQLVIGGIHLHLTRDEGGQIRLKGLDALGRNDAGAAKPPLEALLDFVYRQQRLIVRDASGVVELPDLPPVEIEALEAAVVARDGGHRLGLTARTREGASLDARLVLDGPARTRAEVNGQAYVKLRPDGLDPLVRAALRGPLAIDQVGGVAEAWASLDDGEVTGMSLVAQVDRLQLRADRLTAPVALEDLRLSAKLQVEGDGYRLTVPEIGLRLGGGVYRLGPLGATWNRSPDAAVRWRFAARDLNLAPVREVLLALPLGPDLLSPRVEGILERTAPAGKVEHLAAQGEGAVLQRFSARFHALRMRADGKLPGLDGVSGWVEGQPGAGVVMLDTPGFLLDLPLMFRAPMEMAARGPLRWRHEAGVTWIETGWLHAHNRDATGRAVASLRVEPGTIPELSLIAGLHDGSAAAAPSYIPLKRLPDAAAGWLAGAFRGGRVDHGALVYEGPVRIDPARQQDRAFQIALQARDLSLYYLEGWPTVEDLTARVLLDGREIRARDVSGTLLGTRIEAATADIPPYQQGEAPTLVVQGRVDGPAGDLESILQQTPLAERLPAELAAWRVNAGRLGGHLLLNIPLGQGGWPLNVIARGQVEGMDIANPDRRLNVENLVGPLSFTLADGIQVPEFEARLWGEPVSGSITSAAGSARLDFEGEVTVDALRDWLQAPWTRPATGRLGYDAELLLPGPGGVPLLNVRGDLARVALALPAPLGKKAGDSLSGHLTLEARSGGQELEFAAGNGVRGRLWWVGEDMDRGQVVLGGGAPRRPAEPGLSLVGRLPSLAVGPWADFFSADAPSGSAPAGMQDEPPLRELRLEVGALDVFGLDVDDARLSVKPDGKSWNFALQSPRLAGELSLPAGYATRGNQPLRLNLSLFDYEGSPAASEAGAAARPPSLDPLVMPVADVVIESLVLNGTDFGRWSFRTRPRPDGLAIEQLAGDMRGGRLQGRVDWTTEGDRQRSHFTGSIESGDVARMLRLWDFDPLLESDDLRSLVDVGWDGSPLDVDPFGLQGTVSLEIGESRFPRTDSKTSALRVLGVFNLSTVSRRLRLDFTDLYRKGLSCDSIGGDFRFDGPLVTTRNLVIKSPSAEFRLSGEMNIAERTLNHRMEVTLPVSSNLYVGCLAGPTACAGIFVVERLWGNRLEKMTTLGYRVTGSWDEPKVEEVQGMFERKK